MDGNPNISLSIDKDSPPSPRRALSHRTVTPSNTPASQHTIPTGSPAGHPCTRTAPCGTPLPLRSCKSPTATNKPHVHERTEPLSPDVNGLPQKTAGQQQKQTGAPRDTGKHRPNINTHRQQQHHGKNTERTPSLHPCIPASVLRPCIFCPRPAASYTTRPHTLRECRTVPHNTTEQNGKQHKTTQKRTKPQKNATHVSEKTPIKPPQSQQRNGEAENPTQKPANT